MDETITQVASQEDQAQIAQPVEQPTQAVTTTDEPIPTDQTSEEPVTAPSSPESEDKAVTPEWLQAKGLDASVLDDPDKLKLANMAFNQEKLMSKSRQQASELQKQMATQPLEQLSADPMVQEALERAARAETTVTVSQWKEANGITPEQDQAIGQYIQANPDKGYLLKNGALSLDDVYAMSGVGRQDVSQLKAQGGQEALQTLANKQRATAVSGNAASGGTSTAVTSANVDTWWDGLSSEQRRDPANRAKLDSLM